MDDHWKFLQADAPGAEQERFNDAGWRTLNLPHDWSIEGEFREDAPAKGSGGYLPAGIGWYRRHVALARPVGDRRFWVVFDGVYMNSDVWINGHFLGRHPYGYTSFFYDLTPFLQQGENVIAVRVDNASQTNCRWYSGSGIYRHVWLNIASPIHVAQWGTYVTTPAADSTSATVDVRTFVQNDRGKESSLVLRAVLTDPTGKDVADVATPFTAESPGITEADQSLTVSSPSLWSTATPSLYTLHSLIMDGTDTLDTHATRIGIRSIRYDNDGGFFLNGEHLKMKGVCLHQDAGCLGAAVPVQAWIRRLALLKAMGCNAIRTSHNPPAPEFLDVCDSLGFLVMDEAFDEWAVAKGQIENGYHRYFESCAQSDLQSMIRRDRNHPCVVLWSAGNEVPEQGRDDGVDILRKLVDTFHDEDPTRPVTVANDHIADPTYPARLPFLEEQDIVGYNYVDRWLGRRERYYSIDRHDHPGWRMIGTENVSVPGVRGEYLPWRDTGAVLRGRSRDYRVGMIRAEELWKFTSTCDYVAGDFIWTGIDYLGEAHWPEKSSSSGVMDLCGFPKDGYYFYQSQWTDSPVLHIFPHWNWAGHEGEVISVIAYTNCDSAELFLNGRSYGMKSYVFPQQGNAGSWNGYARPFVHATTSDLHLSWDVPYRPGTLTIVARKDGRIVKAAVQTTSKPAAIRLTPDRGNIAADGHDIASVKTEIVDNRGLLIPVADNLIQFQVEGSGTLAGTDNGDPQDRTSMKSGSRKAFHGLALVVVQSTGESGIIRLRAGSRGLKGVELVIHTTRCANSEVVPDTLK